MIDQGSERWANAEIFRMLGDSERAGLGGNILARKFYLQALGIARKQNAKLWELRTSVGLARLMRDEGETSTAQELLAPIYAWFSEGQDTPDLTDAKGLLDEFS
jgi:predicted ATPase